MNKTLYMKIALIAALTIAGIWALVPPSKTLKPGLDLAGGTSLIYEIDTTGKSLTEQKGLSEQMINILRRRVDPGNIQNLVWRPQGDTRFEIQMPLTSAEARAKRQNYENILTELTSGNINPAVVMQILKKPAEQQLEEFKKLVGDDPNKLEILTNLASTQSRYQDMRAKSESLNEKLDELSKKIPDAGIDIQQVKTNVYKWSSLDENKLKDELNSFLKPEPNSPDTKKFDLLAEYVKTYSEWAKITNQFISQDTGISAEYNKARMQLDQLNLTKEQIVNILSMQNATKRDEALDKLKKEFPDRAHMVDELAKAYEEYKPYQGRLDDPEDLKRMLHGAGILEFRILPTLGGPDLDSEKIKAYKDRLNSKGPKYASDTQFSWCEIEKPKEWIIEQPGQTSIRVRDDKGNPAVIETFGNKTYVLASNRTDECMLHRADKPWELKNASPTRDPETGLRALSFVLDTPGGQMFRNVTAKNLGKPLCILLDGVAISAPVIQDVISTEGIIKGNFSEIEQQDMVHKLNAGSLPARLIEPPISEKTIGPSIGADNRDKGIRSGIIGLIVVVSFMVIYYTLGGAIADVALLMNLLFTLAIMASLNATFTLSGIAGLILTIGMSVDANVLIFERIREEQQRGASLRTAIKNGYEKAFTAIFDSNLTTVISAVILYVVGSEDIKGFAIVLILGLASNLFTAVFVTRVVFDFLLSKGIIKDHLIMLRLIRKPNINWMGLRPIFFTLSAILTIGGLVIFFTRDNTKNNKYDIEFTGGTSVVIDLKKDVQLSRQDVENRIRQIGTQLNNPAIAASSVYSIGKAIGNKPNGEKVFLEYEITTTETNKVIVTATLGNGQTAEKIKASIGSRLPNVSVNASDKPNVFNISTTDLNKSVVTSALKSVFPDAEFSEPKPEQPVNEAIINAFSNELEIQQDLQPKITSAEEITDKVVEAQPELTDFIGGVKISCLLGRPATIEEIDKRLDNLIFKPETQNLPVYTHKILSTDLTPLKSGQQVNSFVYVSINDEFAFRQPTEEEWKQFVDTETGKITAAMETAESLPRVTQISPSVGAEAKMRALIAIILSLFALLVYIWFRFGNLRYGLGAVITLFHDTCVTLGAVTACTYIAQTAIGQDLLIGDFKINLAMIAAFLTLIGYSLNDSIVIYDRIRENRPRAGLTPQIINNSLNETLSRTILTGSTTLAVVLIMYIFGGEGLRGFNFAMAFGIVIGTYSSIAISAPILLMRRKAKS